MQTLLIEPHYLGCLEYFVLLCKFEKIGWEVDAHFTKQTFKNRTVLLSSQGMIPLSVPVKYGNRTPLKEVQIDHSKRWMREHWGAFYSAYGKAPFFEYFAEDFKGIWEKQHRYLVDLNLEMVSLCLHLLQIDRSFSFSEKYQKVVDYRFYDARERIHPKKPFVERKIYLPFPYTQLFGSNFVPNLSIADLLMCEGARAAEVLGRSASEAGEHL